MESINHLEGKLNISLREILEIILDRVIGKSTYFGVRTLKHPFDFWVYQEIIFETKPDVIIEIGNWDGGSLLAMAHFCDNMNHGRLIGVDISHEHISPIVRAHKRITLIEGDACDKFEEVRMLLNPADRILIIEDSSHTYDNTLSILRTYSELNPFYFIVEDGILSIFDLYPEFYLKSPYEAIETFTRENNKYESDRSKESFLITFNPKGYLKLK